MGKNVLDTDLRGKVAVVTGAGGVLCSSFSMALARAGAKVAVLDLNEQAASKTAEEIVAEGGTAKAYACDVLDPDMCRNVADAVLANLGPCDILLNGAGGNSTVANTDKEFYEEGDLDSPVKTFFDLDKKSVGFVFDLNFLGTFIPTQVFARQMLGREGCSILNISSMSAFAPMTKVVAYSGAKAAIVNFTKWLAVYLSKSGIRVNAIAPGFFSTKQNARLLFDENGAPTPRTGKILASTPMGRFGDTKDDLIGAVLFLVNDKAAGFITGACIPIDGGFSAYSGV